METKSDCDGLVVQQELRCCWNAEDGTSRQEAWGKNERGFTEVLIEDMKLVGIREEAAEDSVR